MAGDEMIRCTNVGIEPSEECEDICVISNKCGALKQWRKEEKMKYTKANYQTRLINSIRAFGEWVSENAEKIGNDVEGRTSLDIMASWNCGGDLQPDISIDHRYVSREATEAMLNVKIKEEGNDENI